jgi:NAD(P)-dependent dehydrogenase (short-subunit alcohol dehydrogenase family)
VVLTDIDAQGVERAARELAGPTDGGGSVVGRLLDVRDREAVHALIGEVGRDGIDLVFNNAGLAMGGPTHELTGAHWDHIVDVNLRGVVNGVLAAYPLMVDQGYGHIINTASAAGLAPPPLVVPYATTKHAVVGLSIALRPEAARHGVRVSVLCPGAVETPILDRLPPDGLPATPSAPVTARAYLERLHQRPMRADRFARDALREVARNRALIVLPRSTKLLWYAQRLSPALVERFDRSVAGTVMRDLVRPTSVSRSPRPHRSRR